MSSPLASVPQDVAAIRRHNLALVARLLRDHGELSRTEIVARTGLAAGAVTSLAAALIDAGMAREAGTRQSAGIAGRPRRMLAFDGSSVAVVAAHVDAHAVVTLAVDLSGRELHRSSVGHGAAPGDVETVTDCLAREVGAALAAAEAAGVRPAAVGIAVAGVVVTGSGEVAFAPNLGWRHVPLVDALREATGTDLPILLDNDANLTALAELRALTPDSGARHLVVVSGYAGVGSGVVVDGRLFRGSSGGAGEAGHLVVAPRGRSCWCGRRGCLEAVAAPPELARLARLTPEDPADLGAAMAELAARAERGHKGVLRILDDLGGRLGEAAVILVTVLGSQAVVLGGHYAGLARWVLPRVEAALEELRGIDAYRDVEARAGTRGAAAPVWGAAALAADLVLDDPAGY
ncbi:ROK family protein [Streptomycetaceae bacterium NBC_01309]